MATVKLTPQYVAAAKATRQIDVYDAILPGFGLRVTAAGTKSFFVRYRLHGKQRRLSLGRVGIITLAEARKRARKALERVSAGEDPAAERAVLRKHDVTFRGLCADVMPALAPPRTRPATHRERERMVRAELLPAWGSRAVATIQRRDVVMLVQRIAERGAPSVANRTLDFLNVLFNDAIRRGFPMLEHNPAHLVRYPAVEHPRSRYLTRVEIKAVWDALEPEYWPTRSMLRFTLLTAQRVGAARHLRWGDIEKFANGKLWRTPAAVSKSKRDQLTPLSVEAMNIIDGLRPLTGSTDFVFAGRTGRPGSRYDKAVENARERADLDEHWVVHDFRRTFRTHAVRSPEDGGVGIQPHIADLVLGHSEKSLGFGVYTGDRARYLLSEKRDALLKWGAFVSDIVRGG